MSEKKKQIIHVKELVIKADNVTLDRGGRNYDPFFGPRREAVEEQDHVEAKSVEEKVESSEETNENRVNPFFGSFGKPREIIESRERDFDPILGRPLKREEVTAEATETEEEKKEEK